MTDGADGPPEGASGGAAAPAEADAAADPALASLFETIEQRKRTTPEDSYTATLLTHEKGENAALEKLGEEATETILAAKDGDSEALAAESADLVYHLLVVLAANDLRYDDLRSELVDRF